MDAEFDLELRQDFLVEAGELLQRLGEQLVALETSPRDSELLNAVFRAFHTVKGGAGFLALEPMVLLCHHAEDLLNEARNGKVALDAAHMDGLLQALDLLNDMMAAVGGGKHPGRPGGTPTQPASAGYRNRAPDLLVAYDGHGHLPGDLRGCIQCDVLLDLQASQVARTQAGHLP
ncbi:MAG: Hpt domain-containing protein [Rhodanobacter sp.]